MTNAYKVGKNHKHKDLSFFGPVSDGFVGQPTQLQKGPIDDLIELSGTDWNSIIGGFFTGFTNNFFHKFKGENDNLFLQNHNITEEMVNGVVKKVYRYFGKMMELKFLWSELVG